MLETLNLSKNPFLTVTIPTELAAIPTLSSVDVTELDLVTGEMPAKLCPIGLPGLSFTCNDDNITKSMLAVVLSD